MSTFPERPINHRFTKLAAATEVQNIPADGTFLSQKEMLALLHPKRGCEARMRHPKSPFETGRNHEATFPQQHA
jgi:hypothetical protein